MTSLAFAKSTMMLLGYASPNTMPYCSVAYLPCPHIIAPPLFYLLMFCCVTAAQAMGN